MGKSRNKLARLVQRIEKADAARLAAVTRAHAEASALGYPEPTTTPRRKPTTATGETRACEGGRRPRYSVEGAPSNDERVRGPHQLPPVRRISDAMMRWLESLPDPEGVIAGQLPIARAYNRRIDDGRWAEKGAAAR